jgi:hypothetical protein
MVAVVSLGTDLVLLHHLPPRGKNHIISAFLKQALALLLILRPGRLG